MVEYRLFRRNGRTFIFAQLGEYSSQIEVDTARFDPVQLLEILRTNQVYPEHLQSVYEDLLFCADMV